MALCKASLKCDYCGTLAAVETSELLALDALEHAPTVYAVLTTGDDQVQAKTLWRSLRQAYVACKRRWPAIEWAVIVEFTSGTSSFSNGRRFIHLNLTIKGVPREDAERLHEVISRVWCERVYATPDAQWVGPISDAGGLMRYLALHFLKLSQRPPTHWRGRRIRYTRGYLVRPAALLRQEARASLREKRALHQALGMVGDVGHPELVEAVAASILHDSSNRRWRAVSVRGDVELGRL